MSAQDTPLGVSDPHKRILWSANDAGGMNAIVWVVKALLDRHDQVVGIATGPALAIARQHGFEVQDASAYTPEELQAAVLAARPDIFLAGTSAGDTIDKKIFRLIPHVPSVYVLDFWSNYRLRFSTAGDELGYLPTVVCVMDELARLEMLAVGLDDALLCVTGNPHVEHFTQGITRDQEDPHLLLFVSQPVREVDGMGYGFDEYVVIEHLLRALRKLPEQFRLSIRLHPKDDPHKYDSYLDARVALAQADTLEEALSRSECIIGMFSPVLIQARAAGKYVLSYEPGITGGDPLATNRLGLTTKLSTEDELQSALAIYAAGQRPPTALDISTIWPRGAAERILQVIDSLVCSSDTVL